MESTLKLVRRLNNFRKPKGKPIQEEHNKNSIQALLQEKQKPVKPKPLKTKPLQAKPLKPLNQKHLKPKPLKENLDQTAANTTKMCGSTVNIHQASKVNQSNKGDITSPEINFNWDQLNGGLTCTILLLVLLLFAINIACWICKIKREKKEQQKQQRSKREEETENIRSQLDHFKNLINGQQMSFGPSANGQWGNKGHMSHGAGGWNPQMTNQMPNGGQMLQMVANNQGGQNDQHNNSSNALTNSPNNPPQ